MSDRQPLLLGRTQATNCTLVQFGAAVKAAGQSPGMHAADADLRRDADKNGVRLVAGIEQAPEIGRLPGCQLVTVYDREGDFRNLISAAAKTGAAFLVRASRGTHRRILLVWGGDARMRNHVQGTEPAAPALGAAALRAGGAACPEGPEMSAIAAPQTCAG